MAEDPPNLSVLSTINGSSPASFAARAAAKPDAPEPTITTLFELSSISNHSMLFSGTLRKVAF
jgi:hypothetical protein